MTAITNEPMHEVLKAIQARLSDMDEARRDLRGQIGALRGGQTAIQNQIGAAQHDLAYETLGAMDSRIARVERRLQITDHPAE